MTAADQERDERVLAEHRLTTPVQCLCGWRETDAPDQTHAIHVAQALAAARAESPDAQTDVLRDALAARLHDLIGDWQANGGSRALGDPTDRVWFACAEQLLNALTADNQPAGGSTR